MERFRLHDRHGFTLMELLIVISLIGMLLAVGYTNWATQIKRANDARKKGNIYRMKQVLENYVNDHGCYPAVAQMQSCDGQNTLFINYNMPSVPCDDGGKAFYYELVGGDACKGYRMYTSLGDKADLDIIKLGCDTPGHGCGVRISGVLHPEYNYGISMGGTVVQ
jgi:prepilin-type N-terminal cleavage/methylation domain-containing protein